MDHLSHLVMRVLVLLLCQFGAFTYYMGDCSFSLSLSLFLSLSITLSLFLSLYIYKGNMFDFLVCIGTILVICIIPSGSPFSPSHACTCIPSLPVWCIRLLYGRLFFLSLSLSLYIYIYIGCLVSFLANIFGKTCISLFSTLPVTGK